MDDHPLTRAGLRAVLDAEPGLTVCAEAGSVDEAVAAVAGRRPDLVVTDLSLADGSGLDLTRRLAERAGAPPVLVLSMFPAETHAEAALAAGARGYVTKSLDDREVVRAVRTVLDGGRYRPPVEPAPPLVGPDGLSARERAVFALVGRGYAPRHVAEALSISVHTVEAHRERIKAKLGIASSAMLVRYAVAWALDQAAGVPAAPRVPV